MNTDLRVFDAVKGLQNGGIYKTTDNGVAKWKAVKGLQNGGVYKAGRTSQNRRSAVASIQNGGITRNTHCALQSFGL